MSYGSPRGRLWSVLPLARPPLRGLAALVRLTHSGTPSLAALALCPRGLPRGSLVRVCVPSRSEAPTEAHIPGPETR